MTSGSFFNQRVFPAEVGVFPNAVTFTALLSCLDFAQRWQQTLGLLRRSQPVGWDWPRFFSSQVADFFFWVIFFSRLGEIFDQIMVKLCQMDEKTMYVSRIFRLSIDDGGTAFFVYLQEKTLDAFRVSVIYLIYTLVN